MTRSALAVVLTAAGLLAAAAPAGAQAPPGANDFSCRSAAPPVILVHGTFGDMEVTWQTVSPALQAAGYCVFALDLPRRAMAPIDRSADRLAAFVDEVLARTGAAQVSLVGHDQGGMLGRYVASFRGKLAVIDDVVGLAPASHGTTARLAPGIGCPACAELKAGSAFMQQLAGPPAGPPSYTVVSTKQDRTVTPFRSQALEGATNVVLQDRCPDDVVDHVGIVYDPIALQWTLDALARPGPADPALQPDCEAAGGGSPPFAVVLRRGSRVGDQGAAIRVRCLGTVGRCVGRLALRGLAAAPVDVAAGTTRTVHVPVVRAPRRVKATVTTLQPGGYVRATLRLRRSQDR
jgi:pimeloyl-ACP methyl ester carboxylesterase